MGSEKFTENSEKSSEGAEVVFMSIAAEAAQLVRQAAEPRPVADSVKAAIGRATKRINAHLRAMGLDPIKAGRVEDIWRGEARVIRAGEMRALERAAARSRREETARGEFADLLDRITILEHRLAAIDPDFHRESIDVAREMAGDLGGLARREDRTMDRGGSR